MREYPKIETLWARDEKSRRVIPGNWRMPEFGLVRDWQITEKIDGTNIRIGLNPDGTLAIGGRTDSAQVPTPLLSHLLATFPPEKLREKFPDGEFTIFGEGYGPKIQNGHAYSAQPGFRIFDVLVGDWWLEPENVQGVAEAFGLSTVPRLGMSFLPPRSADELRGLVDRSLIDEGGVGCRAEGVVARTAPALFSRKGERVMWKLKFKDFGEAPRGESPQEMP